MNKKVLYTVFAILCTSSLAAEDVWYTFHNLIGNSFTGTPIALREDILTVKTRQGKQFAISLEELTEEDQKWVNDWSEGLLSGTPAKPKETQPVAPKKEINQENLVVDDSAALSDKVIPRSRKEIKKTIRKIMTRPKDGWMSKDQAGAINRLNAFRYLCGVHANVITTEQRATEAERAAMACKKHGGLSHTLGEFTDKCNLSSKGNMESSVKDYMNDYGSSNRQRRGHRRWCLNPRMKETGFGSAGSRYSAMWSIQQSGKRKRGMWSYPGRGFYPRNWMLGNGWSLYLDKVAPDKEQLTVEVTKVRDVPEEPFNWSEPVPGKLIEVPYVSTYKNAINFEPDIGDPESRDKYWVRVKGGGVKEQYIVVFF